MCVCVTVWETENDEEQREARGCVWDLSGFPSVHFSEPTDLETNNFFKAYKDFSHSMLFNRANTSMLWILTKQSNPLKVASRHPAAASVRQIQQFLQTYGTWGEVLKETVWIGVTLLFIPSTGHLSFQTFHSILLECIRAAKSGSRVWKRERPYRFEWFKRLQGSLCCSFLSCLSQRMHNFGWRNAQSDQWCYRGRGMLHGQQGQLRGMLQTMLDWKKRKDNALDMFVQL